MKKILFALLFLIIPFSVKAQSLKINSLKVNEKEVSLVDNVYEYSASVGNDYTSANIVLTVDDGVTYEINGNENFVVGGNIVKIVLSSNGETKEYSLNILRMSGSVVELSNNNKLKNISVTGYPIGFSSNKLEYDLSIKSEATLKISYEKEDDTAEVYIEGNMDLKVGSVIKIKVIAQSGEVREYKLNIKSAEARVEEKYDDGNKIDLNLVGYIGAALLLSGFLVFINVGGKKKAKN